MFDFAIAGVQAPIFLLALVGLTVGIVGGFIGVGGVRQMVREHDDIFEGVGRLMALSRQSVWADPERNAALESFGLVGEHPEHCDDLCRYVEQLPATQQDALLEQMQIIRREHPEFSAYAIVRRSADGTALRDR